MAQEQEKEIKQPHLIICEGRDAKMYLISLLQQLIKTDAAYDKFQVMDAGGIADIHNFMKALPNLPNFYTVKSITIIRDSEKNSQGASQSIQTALKNSRFAVPGKPCEAATPSEREHGVRVGYALFPQLNAETESGTLEDLCLNTLAAPNKENLLGIVDGAIAQAGELKRPHKNRLHTYLSLTDDFVGLKIGESARAGAFEFSGGEVGALKGLLVELLGDEI